MRFDVITLFPELFAPFLTAGITRRAYASGQVAMCTCGTRATMPRAITGAWMIVPSVAGRAWS
jgi:tRNA G37 N-methylase TrmD